MIERLIKSVGSRYVPEWAVHWSDLDQERRDELLARAPILKEDHFDWLLFGSLPRTATTWWTDRPPAINPDKSTAEPVRGVGPDGREYEWNPPIPPAGKMVENFGRNPPRVGYRAETNADGDIDRFGARFDDGVNQETAQRDWYITFPAFRAGSKTSFFEELWRCMRG